MYVILVLRRKLRRQSQCFSGALGLKITADEIEAGREICRMYVLEMRNGFGHRALGHQQDAEVVVGVLICWLVAKNGAEFFFGEVKSLLRDVNVAQVNVSFSRVWSELQSLLKCCDCGGIILLIAFYDAEQVVSFNARRITLELPLKLSFGLSHTTLLHKRFDLLEDSRRGLSGCFMG